MICNQASEAAQLGEARNYDELQAICRRVADKRQMSREEIDRIAGFTPGLAAKLLCDPPMRRMGPETLPGMLGALGLKLAAIDDPEALERFTKRAEKRRDSYAKNAVKHSGAVSFKLSRRKLRRNGRKGGSNSRKYMTRALARKLARKAGKAGAAARWGSRNRSLPSAGKSLAPAGD